MSTSGDYEIGERSGLTYQVHRDAKTKTDQGAYFAMRHGSYTTGSIGLRTTNPRIMVTGRVIERGGVTVTRRGIVRIRSNRKPGLACKL